MVSAVFSEYRPGIVVNLAAQAGVRYSIKNPDAYIRSNIIGFFNILEACHHLILLPMMKSSTGRSHRALELTRMLQQKSKDELGYYLIGAMVAANYGWIEEPEKQLILEVLKMAQPFQDLYQEFEAKGMEKGMEKGKVEVAKKTLLKNMDIVVIAEITELSVEKIEKLKTNPN